MDHSDHSTDKDGYPVDDVVTEALEILDDCKRSERVMCEYHGSGMIQYFARKKYITGEEIELVYEKTEYRVRTIETNRFGKGPDRGYMELVLEDDE